ncbi:MAG: flavodoxin family protein [Clostridia bacterium]
MRILVLNGSPHRNGNTFLSVESFLSGFKEANDEVKIYHLADLDYTTCIGCNKCYETGYCIFNDDLAPLHTDYDKADFIVISSPIYFFTVSAFLKAAIDRTQALWASKYILKKPTIDRNKKRMGVFIGTGGAPKSENYPQALSPVLDMYSKAINTKLLDEIIFYDTDKIKMKNRPNDLSNLKDMGKKIRTETKKELS